jgi:hypothetical protein
MAELIVSMSGRRGRHSTLLMHSESVAAAVFIVEGFSLGKRLIVVGSFDPVRQSIHHS